MINQVDADVVVVGAGLCGLTAARTLRATGVEVIVLEATEEVGGRARTRQVGGLVANLGGEWVGSHHRRMRSLAAEHRLELTPTRFLGSRVRWRTEHHDTIGRIPPLTRRTASVLAGAFWQAGRLARGLSADAPWCSPRAEALDRISFGTWLRERGVVDDAYELMDTFIGDLVSMPIADLSLLHVLWWVRRNDGPITAARSAFDARLIDGSQELAHRMAMPLRDCIRLGAPVSRVEQNADTVSLGLTDGEELRARRAILALPATRLTNLAFDPALDHANQRLSQELRIGAATKVAAALPSAKSDLPRTVLGGHPLTACWRYGRQITGFARPPYDELPDDTLITELAHALTPPPRTSATSRSSDGHANATSAAATSVSSQASYQNSGRCSRAAISWSDSQAQNEARGRTTWKAPSRAASTPQKKRSTHCMSGAARPWRDNCSWNDESVTVARARFRN